MHIPFIKQSCSKALSVMLRPNEDVTHDSPLGCNNKHENETVSPHTPPSPSPDSRLPANDDV
jgi:hypothetical protein